MRWLRIRLLILVIGFATWTWPCQMADAEVVGTARTG